MRQELYRSETLLVRSVAAADRTRWVVTFDNYGSADGFDRPGFGETYLVERGISVVAILARGNDWYQYPDIDAALACVRGAVADAARVMTYGSSMGGYAAIRFADRVGAHACLALSPQYSNDPGKVPFEWRWTNEGRSIRWLPAIDGPIRSRIRPVIIADARREDAKHVRLITRDIAIELVSIAYAGHPIATYLGSVGMLDRAVMQVLDGSFDAAAYQAEARARRRDDVIHLGELARLQPDSRARTAIALARRALARQPENPFNVHVLAWRLTGIGAHEEALALHARAVANSEGAFGYALPYADALFRAGEIDEATAVAQRLLERHPQMAPVHGMLAVLRWEAGDAPGARRHADIARRLAPANVQYRRLALRYRLPREPDWLAVVRRGVRKLGIGARRGRAGRIVGTLR